jgi:prefoldin subunit 5
MYATEKYVKMEAKELRETINQLANDLGGDIRYLHSMLTDLQNNVSTLQQEIEQLKDIIREK